MSQKATDPVVEEVREVRRRISARFGHDPARLVAHYMALQEGYRDRLVDVRGPADSVAADRAVTAAD